MRLIIVSNRLPVNVVKTDDGYSYHESSGGLASGMRAYVERIKNDKKSGMEISWLGWPGTTVEDEAKVRKDILKKFDAHCVFLSEEAMGKFYEGFCNKTIWPLFHYFPVYTTYEKENWEQYVAVNEIFCNALLEVIKPGDVIWVHDYHLMLLPGMIRKKIPDATIGFFLHIPFPSYEVYRLLPSRWRKDILEGLYGADLIGFHTHDYRTYFLRSTLRILGNNNHMGDVFLHKHLTRVDNFPMGIDYNKYHDAAKSRETVKEIKKLKKNFSGVRLIISIDRQDYSKGILNRLTGYAHFLSSHPEWKEKVTLVMIIVPSRIGVENYVTIKSQIDELVGKINGTYGTMQWMPVVYQYRSITFHELIALYNKSDVALVTPLRDGMNLVAKEFIAARTDKTGVLILSEMAGAADELAESIIINPNNVEEIAEALDNALRTPAQEQARRLDIMQKRISRYDVFKWADDFIASLNSIKEKQKRLSAHTLSVADRKKMMSQFAKASRRILFLDYDGTLTPFADHYKNALPGKELIKTLEQLSIVQGIEIIIISGRDRHTLEEWFGNIPVHLVAEHGLFIKKLYSDWRLLKPIRGRWKKKILPILKLYADKLPGSLIEEKEYSLVFHYRRSEPAFASIRVKELTEYLVNYTSNMDIQVMNGNKVLEVRNAGIDKGVAAMFWLPEKKKATDFILAIGDDRTDEDVFRVMPKDAYTIKVGIKPSYAKYNLYSSDEVIKLLNDFSQVKTGGTKKVHDPVMHF